MSEFSVTVDKKSLEEFKRVAEATGRNISREMRAVINKTASKVRSSTKDPKGLKQRLTGKSGLSTIKGRDLKMLLKVTKRAGKDSLTAQVVLRKTDRFPLKRFSHSQTKKGVSYRIDRRSGRKFVKSAFINRGLSNKKDPTSERINHVFKRTSKARKSIVKLHGISPAALAILNKVDKDIEKDAAVHLERQTAERIDFMLKKFAGEI